MPTENKFSEKAVPVGHQGAATMFFEECVQKNDIEFSFCFKILILEKHKPISFRYKNLL